MTPQQIKALKLALEALEMYGKRHRATYLLGGAWDEEITLGGKAITALEETLQEHAMQEVQRLGQEIEQEPVAHWSDCSVHSEPAYPKGECDCGGIVAVADYTALSDKYVALSDKYVALKAQRKPLTDEQIFACENSVPDEIVSDRDWCIYFARAIEAKLKENT